MYKFNAKKKRIDWIYAKYANTSKVSLSNFLKSVNEIYYMNSVNLYGERYVSDIKLQYKLMIDKLELKSESEWTIVNIGGGTGFEYEQFRENKVNFLKYIFIEPDIEMIRKFCDKNNVTTNSNVVVHQGCFSDFEKSLKKEAKKIIVINSCLHHLIEFQDFMDSIKNCMNAGDLFIVCHEPNNSYYNSIFFWMNYLLRSLVTDFLLRRFGLWKSKKAISDKNRWDLINNQLISSGIIKNALPVLLIRRIIDYGVNSKGDWQKLKVPAEFDEGFWIHNDIIKYMGDDYKSIHFSTYRHFGDSEGNNIINIFNRYAPFFSKKGGSVFALVIRNNGCATLTP